MKDREFFDFDPGMLPLPGGRRCGVDQVKLHRQMAHHGLSTEGMPPLDVSRGSDGELVIHDGVSDQGDPRGQVSSRSDGSLRSDRRSPRAARLPTPSEGRVTKDQETRSELLEALALAELGKVHPNWRLRQTLSNLAVVVGRLDSGAVWDLEDQEALVAARHLLAHRSDRSVSSA